MGSWSCACLPAASCLTSSAGRVLYPPTDSDINQPAPCAMSGSPHSLFWDLSSWGGGRERVQTLTLSAGVQPGFALCSED